MVDVKVSRLGVTQIHRRTMDDDGAHVPRIGTPAGLQIKGLLGLEIENGEWRMEKLRLVLKNVAAL